MSLAIGTLVLIVFGSALLLISGKAKLNRTRIMCDRALPPLNPSQPKQNAMGSAVIHPFAYQSSTSLCYASVREARESATAESDIECELGVIALII